MIMQQTKNIEFYIVDFDRTIADSDKLLEIFIEIADTYFHISKEHLAQVDADIKQRGDTFFLASYVRDQLSSEGRIGEWGDLEKRFIHESRALNYLLPGATELLEWLASHGKRYGILTYGDPLWQRLKLTAAGFNHVHHIILEQKEKGKIISGWQKSDGTFRLPDAFGGGSVDRIIMIDDKAVSFDSFPALPSKGLWVLNPEHELSSQQGTVPNNVTRYSDLYAAIEAL
jgi:phosphoserine phosphatase